MSHFTDPRQQGDTLPQEQAWETEQPWAQEDTDEYIPIDELEDRVHPRTIFKPNTARPNFVLCVAVNVVRILAILVLNQKKKGLIPATETAESPATEPEETLESAPEESPAE